MKNLSADRTEPRVCYYKLLTGTMLTVKRLAETTADPIPEGDFQMEKRFAELSRLILTI